VVTSKTRGCGETYLEPDRRELRCGIEQTLGYEGGNYERREETPYFPCKRKLQQSLRGLESSFHGRQATSGGEGNNRKYN